MPALHITGIRFYTFMHLAFHCLWAKKTFGMCVVFIIRDPYHLSQNIYLNSQSYSADTLVAKVGCEEVQTMKTLCTRMHEEDMTGKHLANLLF